MTHTPAEIREWCIGEGLAKEGRGRLSSQCREAFEKSSRSETTITKLGAPVTAKKPKKTAAKAGPKAPSTLEQIRNTPPPPGAGPAIPVITGATLKAEAKAKADKPSPQSSGKLVAIPCTHGPDKTSLIPSDLLVPPGSDVTWPSCKTTAGTMRTHHVPA